MKRQKATTTKMTNVVHQGWMTKSPPERKLNRSTTFKIFRAQWKKRYFVLRKPSGSLPDQYELHYFKDHRCNSKKGSIDLEQCEKIIESLDSDQFPFLFAIKTICKNKVRSYFLAADSEQEMSSWVQWLCHVCGLKPEEQHIPEPRPQANQTHSISTMGSNGIHNTSQHHSASTTGSNAATAQPTSTSSASSVSTAGVVGLASSPPVYGSSLKSSQPVPIIRTTSDSSSSSSPSYIPLDHCTTGLPPTKERKGSSESVPDFSAPPVPPSKRHEVSSQDDTDEVFVSNLYQHPPAPVLSRNTATPDPYKIPPVRPTRTINTDEEEQRNECYDVPPPRRDTSPRSRASTRTDSAGSRPMTGTPTECYDYPPPRLNSTTSFDGEPPPERPPRPSYLQSHYQNLPPAGKSKEGSGLGHLDLNKVLVPPRSHKSSVKIDYDVPPSSSHHRTVPMHPLSTVTPPPPKIHTAGDNAPHTYLNTQTWPSSGEVILPAGRDRASEHPALGSTPPAIPPPRFGSTGDVLDGAQSSSSHKSLYQSPSSASPCNTSSYNNAAPPARPPARTQSKIPAGSPNVNECRKTHRQVAEDGGSIFSTSRTRSFKKQHDVNNVVNFPGKATTLPMNTNVPRPVFHSRTRELSTSEEDEEATHHPISLLHSVPPPIDTDHELKYIDLALPEAAQDTPRSSHNHGHTHSHGHHADRSKDSATEYREIDFVKTQALGDVKRVKEKERKSDDHN